MLQRVTVFLAICVLLLGGCIAPIRPPTTIIAASPVSMNVCYVRGASSHVAVMYAFEKGLFQKHGLSVQLLAMDGGSKAGTALIAGEADICLMSGGSVINGIAAGADPVIIGGVFNTQIYSLVVAAEIRTANDLKGKVSATDRAGRCYRYCNTFGLTPFCLSTGYRCPVTCGRGTG